MPGFVRTTAAIGVVSLVIALGGPVLGQTAGKTTSYSATAIHGFPEQPETTGIVVKSGQDMRLEYEQGGRNVIQILRPGEGLMYILDPDQKTYIEVRGQAVPEPAGAATTTPCSGSPQIAQCTQVGTDTVSGIQVQRWLLSATPQATPLVVLWDPTRQRALRQEFPDGSVIALTFQAMEDLNGRSTERWTLRLTAPGRPDATGEWWFDPDLRVTVREVLPGGEVRRLENINTSAVDPSLFTVPEGWQKTDAAAPPAMPTAPAASD